MEWKNGNSGSSLDAVDCTSPPKIVTNVFQRKSSMESAVFRKFASVIRRAPRHNVAGTGECRKHQRTERWIAVARANGARSRRPGNRQEKRAAAGSAALSTGPVTPEGKSALRSAIRHGLLADSEERFCAFLAALEAELQPEPGIDASQVEVMAVAHWRKSSARAIPVANLPSPG
jgi:hypothetical protein